MAERMAAARQWKAPTHVGIYLVKTPVGLNAQFYAGSPRELLWGSRRWDKPVVGIWIKRIPQALASDVEKYFADHSGAKAEAVNALDKPRLGGTITYRITVDHKGKTAETDRPYSGSGLNLPEFPRLAGYLEALAVKRLEKHGVNYVVSHSPSEDRKFRLKRLGLTPKTPFTTREWLGSLGYGVDCTMPRRSKLKSLAASGLAKALKAKARLNRRFKPNAFDYNENDWTWAEPSAKPQKTPIRKA